MNGTGMWRVRIDALIGRINMWKVCFTSREVEQIGN
jgi:hypothetical protein